MYRSMRGAWLKNYKGICNGMRDGWGIGELRREVVKLEATWGESLAPMSALMHFVKVLVRRMTWWLTCVSYRRWPKMVPGADPEVVQVCGGVREMFGAASICFLQHLPVITYYSTIHWWSGGQHSCWWFYKSTARETSSMMRMLTVKENTWWDGEVREIRE